MDKFERLNRETREWRNTQVNRFNPSAPVTYGTSEYWRNYWNNQTYKTNNGAYPNRHY